tara:strand:+ start:11 stop:355 length:345 start_codon:yes stop_codon:yes gene_type:complete
MSGDTVAYDMNLNTLEDWIEVYKDIEIYPRYVIEYKSIGCNYLGIPYSEEEDWWSADRGDDLFEWLQTWDDRQSLEDTLYIDVYYQETDDTARDYISRVYQHKDYTVEDIEKLI